ncbi:MAG: hypothetical protein JXR15_09910 [Shimia sp.]|uniref:hypothetical protein n=1 Tax=Shimia sp. TaxID=1954381 RepID=UPI003B8CF033
MSKLQGSDPKVFWVFQLCNIGASALLKVFLPLTVGGINLAYPLFAAKIILLIWMTDFPQRRSLTALAFFILVCLDVCAMLLAGSFSIFSWVYAHLF